MSEVFSFAAFVLMMLAAGCVFTAMISVHKPWFVSIPVGLLIPWVLLGSIVLLAYWSIGHE